ncbi:uncharacterized protein LOC143450785 [Clavelina lepadiformis]|uniref:uncharacterized protein LOC143450785 n=1 Tax=Clavelina lepadiformis TaxID=159417 RepID=UPI0040435701
MFKMLLKIAIFCLSFRTSMGRKAIEYECGKNTTCFKCLNSHDAAKLSREQICDGKFDCKDLSDEFLCPDKRLKYDSRLQYALASLRTGMDLLDQDSAVELTHRMCVPYCTLASVLRACNFCPPGQFQCPRNVEEGQTCTCVKKEDICDGKVDCPEGEDENFCGVGMKPDDTYSGGLNEDSTDVDLEFSNNDTTATGNKSQVVTDNSTSLPNEKILDNKLQSLAKFRIRCSVIEEMSNFNNRRNRFASLRSWSAPHELRRVVRSSGPFSSSSLFSNFEHLGNSENQSVILSWMSHNRRGEPPPIQKYIIRFILGDLNKTDDIFFESGEPLPENHDTVSIDELCDGVIQCSSLSDEILCPGKFYCENREPFYIDKMKIMDGQADCSDGSDEWPLAGGHNSVASRYNLIGDWILQVLVWVMAVTALIGNTVVIWSTITELIKLNRVATASAILQKRKCSSVKDTLTNGVMKRLSGITTISDVHSSRKIAPLGNATGTRRLIKIWNSLLVLNLASADLLMGIYLLWLAVMTAIYEGQNNVNEQYWNYDRQWRTSDTCNILGVILLTSSQTSVYTLVALTTLRLYTVLKPFSCHKLRFRYLIVVCSVTWLVAICFAVIPILPMTKDPFIKAAWVPFPQFHPPDINRTLAVNLVTGIAYITNTNITEKSFMDFSTWDKMVEFLKVAAPDHSDWKYYGYYSADSVCMPQIFVSPTEDRIWGYTLTVIGINFLSVVYIASAYAIISYKSTIQQKPAKQRRVTVTENDENSANPEQIEKSPEISCKRTSVFNRAEQVRKRLADAQKRKRKEKLRQSKNSASEMQKRIALLVATDCACWVPICVMSFISAAGYEIPDAAYAITAIGLLPINSALNPLLYSRFMRSLWSRGWSSVRVRIASSFSVTSVADVSISSSASPTSKCPNASFSAFEDSAVSKVYTTPVQSLAEKNLHLDYAASIRVDDIKIQLPNIVQASNKN